jgi:pyruvyl transferase EpsO
MSDPRSRRIDRHVMERSPAGGTGTASRPGAVPREPAREGIPNTDHELLARLSRTIDATLRPLIPPDRPVALIDFPQYPNVGDSAIWLGALAVLDRLGLGRPHYVCSVSSYSRRSLERAIGMGTILLSGGGNFGDLYESHQEIREDVIANFPANRIIQLPQSISFHAGEALQRARAVINRHPDLTLLVRDHQSLELARDEFRVPSTLCPDLAFALAPLRRRPTARQGVLWLARTDAESLADRRAPRAIIDGVQRVDWLGDRPTALLELNRRMTRQIEYRRRWFGWLEPSLARTFAPAARQRFERGCRLLEVAEQAITDRLHGHILCLMLGLPHALLDNTNGKVRALYDTWTRDSTLTRWCDSEAEALAAVTSDR